ncbi:glycoside hydrolase family 43 protein [Asticcacaulis sp. SL142]|uniref:glycoside hydrolase family 43 protein n=1 Tax=Asticcacaulis sp. SL142 TaxID=2995155 RepID=UPI00226D171D|nr:glycoside hydrolase family 43 protein [Asticcacaulis sp. SL142]WAC49444.1 glycoside hydrolase family 43 protein [Asticcacaulis sp. SL142]
MKSAISYLGLVISAAGLLSGCSNPGLRSLALTQNSHEAVFDWFEYSGSDDLFDEPLAETHFQNPILAGYFPDPSVVRVGSDYYLVNSTFGFYPGIPVFHSRDLISWSQIGNALDRPDMMPFDKLHLGNNGIYAPTIRHQGDTFYIITTCVGCGGNFIITTKDPAGPWSNPIWLPHIDGIDPSLFFDDDGKVYIVHHRDPLNKRYPAHTALWLMEVDPVTFAPRSEDIMLVDGGEKAPWNTDYIEGPHLYKVDGRYYLSAAGGGTGYTHQQLAYRSDTPFGPYTPNPNNPILTQHGLPDGRPDPVTATGHADMFQDEKGQWWAVFLGTRVYDLATAPQDPGNFQTGRETFLLPVSWVDGWPIILEKGKALPYRPERPNLTQGRRPNIPTTGNFTVRDEFDAKVLAPQWLFIRTPRSQWWATGNGKLKINPRTDQLGSGGQPSFVGRRLQHMKATLTTKVVFLPAEADDEAGLMAVQNDEFFYTFTLGRNTEGGPVLRVRKRQGGNDPQTGVVLAEHAINAPPGTPVYLRLDIDKAQIDFKYSFNNRVYIPVLENADAKVIGTALAGGFTGAVIGMYAQGGRP